MVAKPPTELSAFRRSQPGRRFEDRYWRCRKKEAGRSFWWRLMVLLFGAALAGIGFILLFIPGPGILFLAAGGAMAATQSILIARWCDWLEVRFRAWSKRLRTWWRDRRNRG